MADITLRLRKCVSPRMRGVLKEGIGGSVVGEPRRSFGRVDEDIFINGTRCGRIHGGLRSGHAAGSGKNGVSEKKSSTILVQGDGRALDRAN